MVNYIAGTSSHGAITLDEVKVEMNRDNVREHRLDSIAAFRSVKDELTIRENGSQLRNHCLVIPITLQSRVIQLAHEGHQGMSKTKALIRSKVWFPGIDRATEAAVKNCIPCQANSNQRQMEPLNMTILLRGPWVSLSFDFCG